MKICGVDPGLSGALAFVELDENGEVAEALTLDMPTTFFVDERLVPCPRGLLEFFQSEKPDLIVLEHVESRPGRGSVSEWRFAQGFGALLAVAQTHAGARDARVHLVRPRLWKEKLGLNSDKNLSLATARTLFPSAEYLLKRKKDDGRAEALLLVEYARRFLLPAGQVEVC